MTSSVPACAATSRRTPTATPSDRPVGRDEAEDPDDPLRAAMDSWALPGRLSDRHGHRARRRRGYGRTARGAVHLPSGRDGKGPGEGHALARAGHRGFGPRPERDDEGPPRRRAPADPARGSPVVVNAGGTGFYRCPARPCTPGGAAHAPRGARHDRAPRARWRPDGPRSSPASLSSGSSSTSSPTSRARTTFTSGRS